MKTGRVINRIAVLIVAACVIFIAYTFFITPTMNIARASKRINNAGYPAILQACRDMTRNYASYTNEWQSLDPSRFIGMSGENTQAIPMTIRSLDPLDVSLYSNRVLIRFHGPPRVALYAYTDDGDPGDGWQQLTNRLWWWTGGSRPEKK